MKKLHIGRILPLSASGTFGRACRLRVKARKERGDGIAIVAQSANRVHISFSDSSLKQMPFEVFLKGLVMELLAGLEPATFCIPQKILFHYNFSGTP